MLTIARKCRYKWNLVEIRVGANIYRDQKIRGGFDPPPSHHQYFTTVIAKLDQDEIDTLL
jgi:hypothetical protein